MKKILLMQIKRYLYIDDYIKDNPRYEYNWALRAIRRQTLKNMRFIYPRSGIDRHLRRFESFTHTNSNDMLTDLDRDSYDSHRSRIMRAFKQDVINKVRGGMTGQQVLQHPDTRRWLRIISYSDDTGSRNPITLGDELDDFYHMAYESPPAGVIPYRPLMREYLSYWLPYEDCDTILSTIAEHAINLLQ